jgi:hypothetical protein
VWLRSEERRGGRYGRGDHNQTPVTTVRNRAPRWYRVNTVFFNQGKNTGFTRYRAKCTRATLTLGRSRRMPPSFGYGAPPGPEPVEFSFDDALLNTWVEDSVEDSSVYLQLDADVVIPLEAPPPDQS